MLSLLINYSVLLQYSNKIGVLTMETTGNGKNVKLPFEKVYLTILLQIPGKKIDKIRIAGHPSK